MGDGLKRARAAALTVDENVKCSAVVPDEEEDAVPCGALSRYQVARSDGDESFGINGGSDEACEEHLAEAIDGMINGDTGITAAVTIRWDKDPDEMAVVGEDVDTTGNRIDWARLDRLTPGYPEADQ